MLALVAARQRTQAAEAVQSAEAPRQQQCRFALRVQCHSAAALPLTPVRPSLHQRRQVQCSADGAWGVDGGRGGGRGEGESRTGAVGKSRSRGTGSLSGASAGTTTRPHSLVPALHCTRNLYFLMCSGTFCTLVYTGF